MYMSQVKKYQSGGKPDVRIIKRANDNIDLDRYIRNLEYNFDSWLNSRNLKDEEKTAVRKAYRDMIEGYNNENITPGLGNKSVDSTSKISNSEEGFDAYGVAQDYFNTILQHQPVYEKPTKAKFDSRKAWNDYLSKQAIDYDLFKQMTQEDQNQYLSKLLTEYTQGIKGEDYDGYDSNYTQSVLDLFNKAIADPELTAKERMDLSSVGIDLSKFFSTKEEEKTELEQAQEAYNQALQDSQVLNYQRQTDLLRLMQDYYNLPKSDLSLNISQWTAPSRPDVKYNETDQTRKDIVKKMMNEFQQWFRTHDIYKLSNNFWDQVGTDSFGVHNIQWKDSKSGKTWWELDPTWTNSQRFAYLMDLYSRYHNTETDKGPMPFTAEGHHMMSYNNGYETVYDPVTKTFQLKRAVDIPGFIQHLPEFSEYQVITQKQGGILKAQFGTAFQDIKTFDKIKAEYDEGRKQEEKAAINNAKGNRTEKQYLEGQRNLGEGLTAIDKARMASIAVDLGSAIASFTGVGSVAGGIGGLASTALSTIADWNDDAVSKSDLIKNTLLGLGVSAIGFVPGLGGTSTLARGISKVIKYVPKILVAASSGQILLDNDIQKSVNKFKDVSLEGIANPTEWFKKNKITNDDLRNLMMAVGAAAGISRMGNNSLKKRIVKSNTAPISTQENLTIKVKTSKGVENIKLTKDQYNAINEAANLDEANKILKAIPGQENSSVLATRKYKVAGAKQFDKSSLKQTTEKSGYMLDPNFQQSWLGKAYLGNIDSKSSDISLIMSQLNQTYDPFKGGIFFKRKSQQQSTPQTVTPQQSSPQPTHQQSSSQRVSTQPTPQPVISQQSSPRSDSSIHNQYTTSPSASIQLLLNMPRRFQLADGRIAENLKYKGQQLDISNIRQLVNSGKFHFMNKNEIKSLIPGAQNAIQSVDRPDLIYFWEKGGKSIPFKYASGGSIPKYVIGGTVTNTSHNNNYSWDNIIYNTDYFKNVLRGITKDNFEDANALQNRFYNDKINDQWSNNKVGYRDAVKAYQTAFNNAYGEQLNRGAIEAAIANKLITRSGNTGDNADGAYSDGYTGAMTNLRHLGTQNAAKYIPAMNKILKENNLEAYVNPSTKMINYRLIIKPAEQPTDKIATKANNKPNSTEIVGVRTEEDIKEASPWEGVLQKLTPHLLGYGRLLGTLRSNNQIYNTMRQGLRPTLLNTYELHSPVTGAFSTLQFSNNRAAQLRHQAATPFTSDAALNFARQLEADKQAIDIERQGLLADDQEIKRTSTEALRRHEDNVARRTEIANRNTASINDNIRTLAQLKSDYLLKNWNALANFLTERQQEANNDLTSYRAFAQSVEQQRLRQKFEDAIYPEKEALQKAREANKNNPNWNEKTSPEYKAYQAKHRLAQIDLQNGINSISSRLFGWPYTPITGGWRITNVQ